MTSFGNNILSWHRTYVTVVNTCLVCLATDGLLSASLLCDLTILCDSKTRNRQSVDYREPDSVLRQSRFGLNQGLARCNVMIQDSGSVQVIDGRWCVISWSIIRLEMRFRWQRRQGWCRFGSVVQPKGVMSRCPVLRQEARLSKGALCCTDKPEGWFRTGCQVRGPGWRVQLSQGVLCHVVRYFGRKQGLAEGRYATLSVGQIGREKQLWALDLSVRISSLARECVLGGCTIWVDLMSSPYLGFRLCLVKPHIDVFVPWFCTVYLWTVFMS